MPYLNFKIHYPYQNLEHVLKDNYEEFMNWVLASRGSNKITSFRISLDNVYPKCYEEIVMRWIRIAALRNVEELELIVNKSEWGEDFTLLNCLVNCESLRVLKVTMQSFFSELPSHLNFKHLKSLYLELVEFSNHDLVRKLLSECSVLEDLSLINCIDWQMKILDISSSSLKCLTLAINYCASYVLYVHSDCEIRISCPNLVSFTYMGGVAKKFYLDNISSLDYLCIYIDPDYLEVTYWGEEDKKYSDEEVGHLARKILGQVENIRVLKLLNHVMQYLCAVIEDPQCFSTQFHRLKFLNLSLNIDERCTQGMFLLLKHCPNLESLTLVSEQTYWEYTGQNELWQLPDEGNSNWESHLKSVHFINFEGEEHELRFVKFMLKNALALEKFIIDWLKPTEESLAATKNIVSEYPKASTFVEVKIVPKCCPDALLKEHLAYS